MTPVAELKKVHRAVWAAGDYASVAEVIDDAPPRDLLAHAVVAPGHEVLDVAAGTGNIAIPAAAIGARTVGLDLTPELFETARRRAAEQGVDVEWVEGDAEDLPFEDESFDRVLSAFGVMFAPRHEVVARELARVCRPGGRIGLVNWTPDSFIGQLFKTIAGYVPPPAGLRSPMLWGTEERLRQLFADGISSLQITRRQYVFRYRSAEHWLEVFRTYYGPMTRTFAALPAEGQAALTADLLDLARRHNRAGDRGLAAPSDYLEVVAVRA
jgi:ubiquinone/menaquinone biosynthesis C-methylase UbiE